MPEEKLIEFLCNSKLVSYTAAQEIAGRFTPLQISKNEFFLSEGIISDQYLFLENGFMRSFATNLEGNEVTTNFHAHNQVVFEVSSFFNRTRSKENIQALTNCDGYYITFEELNELFHRMPEFREFGRSVLVNALVSMKNKMLSVITETAEDRYVQLIKTNPEIFQYAALKHIASYLGVTDTSLSRIRKDFRALK